MTDIYVPGYPPSEVINMDLFWSGLAKRASEHTRIERRSQFSKVHRTAIQDIEMSKQRGD